MLEWADDLKLRDLPVYLDSRQPRDVCFVSHAHSDHLGVHARPICTPVTAALMRHRTGAGGATELAFGQDLDLCDHGCADTRVRLLPAGHVLGSAMLHVTRPAGTLLYTGDFKLRTCLTVEPAELAPADVLVTETTYGLPFFRFPDRRLVAEQLIDLVAGAFRAGRQPIVMGYSLGKAQEITRILTGAGFAVTAHGAVHAMSRLYAEHGVPLGDFRRYRFDDFHGPHALDLRQRGVLVAPPNVARSPFVTRFDNPLRIVMTGWALLKNAKFRYGVDHALPLSDHADFDELLETVDRVRPRKVYTHHGYREFADELKRRGIDAEPARPGERQLALFEE
jgi:Cft2 family RNA processing exonuclease